MHKSVLLQVILPLPAVQPAAFSPFLAAAAPHLSLRSQLLLRDAQSQSISVICDLFFFAAELYTACAEAAVKETVSKDSAKCLTFYYFFLMDFTHHAERNYHFWDIILVLAEIYPGQVWENLHVLETLW